MADVLLLKTWRNGIRPALLYRHAKVFHQQPPQSTSAPAWMCADCADLHIVASDHPFPCHGNQLRSFLDAKVGAHLIGARAERTGLRQLDKAKHTFHVFNPESPDDSSLVYGAQVAPGNHLEYAPFENNIVSGRHLRPVCRNERHALHGKQHARNLRNSVVCVVFGRAKRRELRSIPQGAPISLCQL
jgi:hypothetical protein